MELKPITVKPEQLVLDPNNYRFHDLEGFKPVVNHRKFGDDNIQAKTLILLQSTPEFYLQSLKDSILTNGFVQIEQIVVEEYESKNGQGRFLVVEGNRRVAAIKTLIDEHQSGIQNIPQEKLSTLKKARVIEVLGDKEERASYKQTLMAIRHVAGITPWGSYQQAKLIMELYEQEEGEFGAVAQRVGIPAREVARRFRAIKALEQMEGDDEYGSYASPHLYAFFQEAISAPTVKEWLGWSDKTYSAENEQARTALYDLFIPRTIDGMTYPVKLKDIRQVRELKNIVGKPAALDILLDLERSLDEAIEVAKSTSKKDMAAILEVSINQAMRALNQPGIDAWLSPTETERALWQKLVQVVGKIDTLLNSK